MLARALSVTLIGLSSSAGVQLVHVTTAHAYRNPERFAAAVEEGGGGGKFFTLSRAEGYGCAVCHSQGGPVAVEVRNLPTTGFIPSQPYRITIDWPDEMPSVALNVEMTDFDGGAFGQITAPDPSTLQPADLCPSDSLFAGQSLVTAPTGRRVLLVAECGQAQTSFDWIAPAAFGRGYFSTSVVLSNRDGKLNGDHVVDFSETLGPRGLTQPVTSLYAGGCSVAISSSSAARARTAWPLAALICGLSRFWRWRRVTRTRADKQFSTLASVCGQRTQPERWKDVAL